MQLILICHKISMFTYSRFTIIDVLFLILDTTAHVFKLNFFKRVLNNTID
jgi:hypothetical protein